VVLNTMVTIGIIVVKMIKVKKAVRLIIRVKDQLIVILLLKNMI